MNDHRVEADVVSYDEDMEETGRIEFAAEGDSPDGFLRGVMIVADKLADEGADYQTPSVSDESGTF